MGIRQYRAYRYCSQFGHGTVSDISSYMGVPVGGTWGGAYRILEHHPLLLCDKSSYPMRYYLEDEDKEE